MEQAQAMEKILQVLVNRRYFSAKHQAFWISVFLRARFCLIGIGQLKYSVCLSDSARYESRVRIRADSRTTKSSNFAFLFYFLLISKIYRYLGAARLGLILRSGTRRAKLLRIQVDLYPEWKHC
jgi:hypothetical protein